MSLGEGALRNRRQRMVEDVSRWQVGLGWSGDRGGEQCQGSNRLDTSSPNPAIPHPSSRVFKGRFTVFGSVSWKGMGTAATFGLNKLFVSKRESKAIVNTDCTFDLF